MAEDEDQGEPDESADESAPDGSAPDESAPDGSELREDEQRDGDDDDAPDGEPEDEQRDGDVRDDEPAGGDDAEPDEPDSEAAREREAEPAGADETERKASKLWWLLPIAVLVEFWFYGHNGYLEVCVGKEGETDFALVGSERTDANRWKFPRCETRLNLGLRSERDAKVEEATKVACRGATLFKNRGQAAQCEAQSEGWERHVEGRFCPPWDRNYYEHLFWFLQ